MNHQELRISLLPLLEDMLTCALNQDKDNADRINSTFSRIYDLPIPVNGPVPLRSELESLYDNCRQSCMGSFAFPMMKGEFIDDARQRLKELKRYSEI